MNGAHLTLPAGRLPPTTESLLDDKARPYFLWWTDATVGRLKEHLVSSDPEERAYWMGALLREANTRDVWLFVTPDEIRASWKARGMEAKPQSLGMEESANNEFGRGILPANCGHDPTSCPPAELVGHGLADYIRWLCCCEMVSATR